MAERTGGQLLVDVLAHQGVRTIFGIPGVQLDNAADALYQAADRISFFCARNEQATTYMADGYARSTGTPRGGDGGARPWRAERAGRAGHRVLGELTCAAARRAAESRLIGKGYGALHEIPDQAGILSRLTKW